MLSKEQYDFLVANDWKPTAEAQRHFYPPHIVDRQRNLAAEQARGIAQQKALLEEARSQRALESNPVPAGFWNGTFGISESSNDFSRTVL